MMRVGCLMLLYVADFKFLAKNSPQVNIINIIKPVILRNFNSEESLGFRNPSVTCGGTSLYTRGLKRFFAFAQNDILSAAVNRILTIWINLLILLKNKVNIIGNFCEKPCIYL